MYTQEVAAAVPVLGGCGGPDGSSGRLCTLLTAHILARGGGAHSTRS